MWFDIFPQKINKAEIDKKLGAIALWVETIWFSGAKIHQKNSSHILILFFNWKATQGIIVRVSEEYQ